MYETLKSDIVFEANNKKYAIEVETGASLTNYRKILLKKVENLKKAYGNNWFFVATNKKITPEYAKLGPATDRRYVLNKIKKLFEKQEKL